MSLGNPGAVPVRLVNSTNNIVDVVPYINRIPQNEVSVAYVDGSRNVRKVEKRLSLERRGIILAVRSQKNFRRLVHVFWKLQGLCYGCKRRSRREKNRHLSSQLLQQSQLGQRIGTSFSK